MRISRKCTSHFNEMVKYLPVLFQLFCCLDVIIINKQILATN
jgi:hypothetical protein